jgi:aldehyde dehydrogenase (NAD+)
MAASAGIRVIPEVTSFLTSGCLSAVIGGKQAASSNNETFQTVDPGSGEVLADVYAMQPEDVDRAVRAATKSFAESAWARLSPNHRSVLLHRLADEVEKRKRLIAQIEALDCGKIYAQFVDTCVQRLQNVVVGYPLDQSAQMGPLVNRQQCERGCV